MEHPADKRRRAWFPDSDYELKSVVGSFQQISGVRNRVTFSATARYRCVNINVMKNKLSRKRIKGNDDNDEAAHHHDADDDADKEVVNEDGEEEEEEKEQEQEQEEEEDEDEQEEDEQGDGGAIPMPEIGKRRARNPRGATNLWRARALKISWAYSDVPIVCPFITYTFLPTTSLRYNEHIGMDSLKLVRAVLSLPAADAIGDEMRKAVVRMFYRVDQWRSRLAADVLGIAKITQARSIHDVFQLPSGAMREKAISIFGRVMRTPSAVALIPVLSQQRLDRMTDDECDAAVDLLQKDPVRYILSLDPSVPQDYAHWSSFSLDPSNDITPVFEQMRRSFYSPPLRVIGKDFETWQFPDQPPTRYGVVTDRLLQLVFRVWAKLVEECRRRSKPVFDMEFVRQHLTELAPADERPVMHYLASVKRLTCVDRNKFALTDMHAPAQSIANSIASGRIRFGVFIGRTEDSINAHVLWMRKNLGPGINRQETVIICPTAMQATASTRAGDIAFTLDEYASGLQVLEARQPIRIYVFRYAHLMNAAVFADLLAKIVRLPIAANRPRGVVLYGDGSTDGIHNGPRGPLDFFDGLTRNARVPHVAPIVTLADSPVTSLRQYTPSTKLEFVWNGRAVRFVQYIDDSNTASTSTGAKALPTYRRTAAFGAHEAQVVTEVVRTRETQGETPALMCSSERIAGLLNTSRRARLGKLCDGSAVVTHCGDVGRIVEMCVEAGEDSRTRITEADPDTCNFEQLHYRLAGRNTWTAYRACPIRHTMFEVPDVAHYSRADVVYYVTASTTISQADFENCLGLTSKLLVIFLPRSALLADFHFHYRRPSIFDFVASNKSAPPLDANATREAEMRAASSMRDFAEGTVQGHI